MLGAYEETKRDLEQLNHRLREAAEQAGPVSEYEAMLNEADMPQRDKAALLRRAKEKDNQAAKHLRAEAAKLRSTARGAEFRESGLREEMALRTRRGHHHVDPIEPPTPPGPTLESPYVDGTSRSVAQPYPTPESDQDVPPI